MDDPEQTFFWLNRDNTPFQPAIKVLLENIHRARGKTPFQVAQQELNLIKETADRLGDESVRAKVRLECAWAAYKLHLTDRVVGDLKEALHLLEFDKSLNPANRHNRGMAHWMLGSQQFQLPAERKQAIHNLQACLDEFILLSYPLFTVDPECGWYKERCAEMRQAIQKVVRGKPLTDSPRRPAPIPHLPGHYPSWPKSTLYPGKMNTLEVIATIPAGSFGPSGIEPEPMDTIELSSPMEEFTIGGRQHILYNLRGSGSATNLISSEKYYLLKVNGDSMNQAFIDPDDYVLVRRQAAADHGDIVAAEIIDVDTAKATLKRFVKKNGGIELHPVSDNPAHQKFPNEEHPVLHYEIRCVALGVFKPITPLERTQALSESSTKPEAESLQFFEEPPTHPAAESTQFSREDLDEEGKGLFDTLVSIARGKDIAIRLIENERKQRPNLPINESIQDAIHLLVRDRH